MDREELAWAAGFFDGEGNTNTYDTRITGGRLAVQLKVAQIHRETLERFQRIVPGGGRVYGPYLRPANDQFQFKVSGFEGVQAIIAQLWPWLTPVKRDQATEALVRYRSGWKPRKWVTSEARRRYRREWMRAKRRQVADG